MSFFTLISEGLPVHEGAPLRKGNLQLTADATRQVRQFHSAASSKVSGTLWGDSTFARLLAQVFEGELEGIQQVRLGLRQSLALRLHAGHFLQPEDVTALGGGLINSGELHGANLTSIAIADK